MSSTIITAQTVFTGKGVIDHGAVWYEDGRIRRVGADWKTWDYPENTTVIERNDFYLVPGYIDIHHHGAGGFAYDDGYDASLMAVEEHHRHGTARCVMSYVTGSMDEMSQRVAAGARVTHDNPRVLGLHLEGPFLDPKHKGAHPERHLVDPTPERVERLLEAADGTMVQITIAPERQHAMEAIRTFTDNGVIAAVGHCNADYETAKAAFDAGARILTHAFNAMNPIHHRKPGPVIAALRDERIWIEVINDTIHVHPAVVRSLFEEASERLMLVTDAMSATCRPDGDYMLGELPVYVKDGVARLRDGDNLAGSTLTMDRAVAHSVKYVGVDLQQAIASATWLPACAIGVQDEYGLLAAGYPADLLVLDPQSLLPSEIYFDGELQ